eukprot:PhM_4_TR1957/c0_g1_i1/m.40105
MAHPGLTIVAVLLLLSISTFNGAIAAEQDIKNVHADSIHDRYALGAAMQMKFNFAPGKCVDMFRESGYTIVPAPDSAADHPQLFYVRAPYTIGVLKADGNRAEAIETTHPLISVIVHPNGASMTYRALTTNIVLDSREAKLKFCNEWNFRYRLGTCFVDKEGNANLQSDMLFVSDVATEFNGAVVVQNAAQYERSLKVFAKKLVETPHKEHKGAEDL